MDSLFLGGSIEKRFLNCRGPSDPAGGRYYLEEPLDGELTMRLDYSSDVKDCSKEKVRINEKAFVIRIADQLIAHTCLRIDPQFV